MKLLDSLLPAPQALVTPASFGFDGNQYQVFSWGGSRPDVPDSTFLGYIAGIHERNGPVAAAVEARALPLSQLRFEWERSTGDRFRNRATRRLNRPGSRTRPEFYKQLEYDVSYSGSATVVASGGSLFRLRPDHVSVVLGSNSDPEWDGDTMVAPHDAQIVGVIHRPSKHTVEGAQFFGVGEFMRWCPEPHPVEFWRGTSWVSSVMREITTDDQATDHQSKFFENAATPNLVFLMDPTVSAEKTQAYADVVNKAHTGTGNAYKNMFLGGGTDVKVVGSTLESLNLKDLTGGLETRIALRARIPGVILGVREGYSGSSLNAGNYGSARRQFADGWFAPTAESLCAALESLVVPPADSELAYDPSRVLFLQEDQKDAAEIMATQSAAARQLIDGGFEPSSVVEALSTNDMTKLRHTGQLSVQLQPPGSDTGEPSDDDTE